MICTSLKVFKESSCPESRESWPIARSCPWRTWTDEARGIIAEFSKQIPLLPKPVLVAIDGYDATIVTYTLAQAALERNGLFEEVRRLADALRCFKLPAPGLAFLCDLFGDGLHPELYFYLFSLLRNLLSSDEGREAAIYAPIQPAPPLGSPFPLHADLFKGATLLTVFNNVPDDDSGASLFLRFEKFSQLIEEIGQMPSDIKERIRRLNDNRDEDHYDEFIDLLYNPGHSWHDQLEQVLIKNQLSVKLGMGQGYILDDRQWLHGRSMQSRPVEMDRLYRLVFETERESAAMSDSGME